MKYESFKRFKVIFLLLADNSTSISAALTKYIRIKILDIFWHFQGNDTGKDTSGRKWVWNISIFVLLDRVCPTDLNIIPLKMPENIENFKSDIFFECSANRGRMIGQE